MTTMGPGCIRCGCTCVSGADVHVIAAALAADDLDTAMTIGLLDAATCAGCDDACTGALQQARAQRRAALDARERFRAREVRLARRRGEREQRPGAAGPAASALPAAAAAALARAKARAASPR